MKRSLFLTIAFIFLFSFNFAQETDTNNWTKGGNYALNFSQVSLTNWSAGGQNSISGVSKLNAFANYQKDLISWSNTIDLGYGLSKFEDQVLQKNEDIIDLQSKLGMKTKSKWHYSALFSFKSQFAAGYSDALNENLVANFMAPAYIGAAIGMDYKPTDNFALLLAPVSGKFTFVTDPDIDARDYGLANSDDSFRAELGASVKLLLKGEVLKNVSASTELNLFSNYLNNPQNIDVDWKVNLVLKVNDYLSAQIDTRLLYDADIVDPLDQKAKIQFKELLGVGFNYKF